MKIKHFMYLLALVLMINLNACSSDSPEEEIPEVPPQEEPGTDPNAPRRGHRGQPKHSFA